MSRSYSTNEMLQRQLEHRTIREFKDENLPEEVMAQLIEVARRTATSTGMQASSIIRVTDPMMKKDIANVCNQEYIARAPELLIFIVDQYRNWQIAKEMNCDRPSVRDLDRFISAFTDACLMAQNMVNAAESLGLGTVYLGSIHNDSSKICSIINLPELTFPVIGLGIGYPNQDPQLKPRMDMKLRVFENTYTRYDDYLDKIKEYDEEMTNYYDLRDTNRRSDCFSDQVVNKLNFVNPKRQEIINVIQEQGFDLKLRRL
jgi:nitroreductase